jgi:ribose transport system permease protein
MIPFASILAIVALGQTLVIQQGGIDLSVPGIVSLSGVIVSYFTIGEPGAGSHLGFAAVYALAMGLVADAINGLLVSPVRVAPIVATIGMNAVLYGIDLNISAGTPVQVPLSLSYFADRQLLGVSHLAYLALGLTAMITFIIKKTVFGRRFEVVGANAGAAPAWSRAVIESPPIPQQAFSTASAACAWQD